ncbi:YaaR family protein [Hydrogenispora ethanolica]|uniref:YaaR family protein n=1 Tax=Hydrogenispora ethanolica TaxID=1082276 RepID=UPI0010517DA9|nr:YaaR family protein [Hydrogenispora ethanolica]
MQIKINNTNAPESPPVETRIPGPGRTAEFTRALRDSDREHRRQICDQLLGKIDALSRELKNHPTPKGFMRYRSLVSSFMKEALSQSYEVRSETHWDRDGNRKSLVAVKRINTALEEMMDAVVQKEKSQIDLAAKFDQIRGWLLDLYV